MKKLRIITTLMMALSAGVASMRAQEAAPPPAEPTAVPQRSDAELDQLLAPIALYPDPLIAQILPAATQPSQIVLADRYVSGGGDPNAIDQQPWDPSVQALARYPTVLKMLDDNLAWTTDLGQTFVNQPQDVMNSVQRLRAKAQSLGNLQTTPQENVVTDDGSIEIVPADPQVIYVPQYQPDVVYYQTAYGGPFITFGFGFPIGIWLNCDFDWHHHHVVVWDHNHPRPPDWWGHHPGGHPSGDFNHATVWHPPSNVHPSRPAPGSDRGWGGREAHPVPTFRPEPGPPGNHPTQSRPVESRPVESRPVESRPVESRPGAPGTIAPHPVPAPSRPQQPAPVMPSRPIEQRPSTPARGALIGVQSAHDTQQFSTRGHGKPAVHVAATRATTARGCSGSLIATLVVHNVRRAAGSTNCQTSCGKFTRTSIR